MTTFLLLLLLPAVIQTQSFAAFRFDLPPGTAFEDRPIPEGAGRIRQVVAAPYPGKESKPAQPVRREAPVPPPAPVPQPQPPPPPPTLPPLPAFTLPTLPPHAPFTFPPHAPHAPFTFPTLPPHPGFKALHDLFHHHPPPAAGAAAPPPPPPMAFTLPPAPGASDNNDYQDIADFANNNNLAPPAPPAPPAPVPAPPPPPPPVVPLPPGPTGQQIVPFPAAAAAAPNVAPRSPIPPSPPAPSQIPPASPAAPAAHTAHAAVQPQLQKQHFQPQFQHVQPPQQVQVMVPQPLQHVQPMQHVQQQQFVQNVQGPNPVFQTQFGGAQQQVQPTQFVQPQLVFRQPQPQQLQQEQLRPIQPVPHHFENEIVIDAADPTPNGAKHWFKDRYDVSMCRSHLASIERKFRNKFPPNLQRTGKDAQLASVISERLFECEKKQRAGHWDKVEHLIHKIQLSKSEESECRMGMIQERISCVNLLSYSCQFIDPTYDFKLVPARITVNEARQAESGAEKCRKVVKLVKKRLETKQRQ